MKMMKEKEEKKEIKKQRKTNMWIIKDWTKKLIKNKNKQKSTKKGKIKESTLQNIMK